MRRQYLISNYNIYIQTYRFIRNYAYNYKSRIYRTLATALIIALTATPARAEVTVLLHGLLGSSYSWEKSGAIDALNESGWRRAGRIQVIDGGEIILSAPTNNSTDRNLNQNKFIYLADIRSLISLEKQAAELELILTTVSSQHPDEPIYLVGHSAGGVVARMVVVANNIPNIRALITIASPHLGSPYANLAYDIATLPYPLRIIPKMLANKKYKTLRRSRAMIRGLIVARPNSMLYWLNRQQHPDINYISIVRNQLFSEIKKALVPLWSQDMNRVAALQGKSSVIPTYAPHAITVDDGYLLGDILNMLTKTRPLFTQ
ncbi:MAG: alpha/beta fold hydrolase [Thiotrichales bacterium]|jgi:pimeloyl-ACP methyl ester carboxylesterase|nr:alpha/beta fold hydrolase [Thiotrichales bacterium]MBT3612915.1 alpha/beta fold hydrolase [Thiotrichales bacterium]MBT3752314.1 alpha/beta fold hydrolase [Thiotrichales bacterium]MBT3837066.1 alpha/beta fold hydrolase [Thiotrichales bacterium]MBT4152485.1 alpha/beta fold hydrolase [Thiotrichales bacterium]